MIKRLRWVRTRVLGSACMLLVSSWAGLSVGAVPRAGAVTEPPLPDPGPTMVNAEVTLIHATADADAGIDPRIGKLPQLGNFKSYRLLSRSNVAIRRAAPTTTALPNGRNLQISLKDVKDARYIIDTSIDQPGGSTFLPLLQVRASVDVPVFIAGQTYQGGMLIIGIKILR